MSVEKRIKLYLVEHDISQKKLAVDIGMTQHTLSLVLNSKRKLSIDEYQAIINALNVSADKFMMPRPKIQQSATY